MIHRVFTDAELATDFSTAEAIRPPPDMTRFMTWLNGTLGTVLIRLGVRQAFERG